MRVNRGRIERQRLRLRWLLDQSGEDDLPSSRPRPAVEAIIDRRVRGIITLANAPTRATLEHVNDAANDPPVVYAARSLQPRRQLRLDPRPLLVIQPEHTLSHLRLPSKYSTQRIPIRDLSTDPRIVDSVPREDHD